MFGVGTDLLSYQPRITDCWFFNTYYKILKVKVVFGLKIYKMIFFEL